MNYDCYYTTRLLNIAMCKITNKISKADCSIRYE